MPELPEVETVCRGLRPRLVGRRFGSVRVLEPRLRYPVDTERLVALVRGAQVREVSRRAKYVRIHLDGGTAEPACLVLHLGMSGTLRFAEPDGVPPRHTHVVFGLDDGSELRFRDPRRFGMVEAIAEAELDVHPRFAGLGVEPLSEDFTGEWLQERARGLRKPVKNLLMDARQIVGVGNIYANEALFLAGVHPARAAGRISRVRWERVARTVRSVLAEAIEEGGTTLRDFEGPLGGEGWFRVRLRVYGREGEACSACGAAIRRRVLAGRSTFYCPGCQR